MELLFLLYIVYGFNFEEFDLLWGWEGFVFCILIYFMIFGEFMYRCFVFLMVEVGVRLSIGGVFKLCLVDMLDIGFFMFLLFLFFWVMFLLI